MKAKILVAYHKLDFILNSDLYIPIQLGRSISSVISKDGKNTLEERKLLLKNTIGDDLGENISDKNRSFNEMTAIYWAWKNLDKIGNPDYIGLTHYRRHFLFKDIEYNGAEWLNGSKVIIFNSIDNDYLKLIDKKDLESILKHYDGIVSNLYDLKNINKNYNNCKDHYRSMIGAPDEIFDSAMEYIYNNYPDYREDLKKFLGDCKHYLCNMFVMKREDFIEYCEFIFPILFEIEKKRALYENGNSNQKRTPGFISEWLTTIYIYHLQRVKGERFKECYLSYIEDTTHELVRKKYKIAQIKYSLIILMMSFVYMLTLGLIGFKKRRLHYIKKIRSITNGCTRYESNIPKYIISLNKKCSRFLQRKANYFDV